MLGTTLLMLTEKVSRSRTLWLLDNSRFGDFCARGVRYLRPKRFQIGSSWTRVRWPGITLTPFTRQSGASLMDGIPSARSQRRIADGSLSRTRYRSSPTGSRSTLATACCASRAARRIARMYAQRYSRYITGGVTVRRRAAQLELLASVKARAARRLVVVRLDLGVQATQLAAPILSTFAL